MKTSKKHALIEKLSGEFDTNKWWLIRQRAIKQANNKLLTLLLMIRYRRFTHKNGGSIPLNTHFESCPILPHGVDGVFISSGASIGRECVIFHQVTIGSNTLADSKNKGCPYIGDSVYIGCGAKIIGNVRIGNNVRIGANCIITSDIPDNCTVVLQQPRIIKKNMIINNHFEEM